jgi:acyl-[acyl-carrier-protein]-phospholipid O-acyltransferase/long-chain-fatty-acid--[acyl-carrier-protein] ligase
LASLSIPRAAPPMPTLRISPNIFGETWRIVRTAAANRDVFLSILGISWTWLAGATFLTQLPAFSKDVLGANEQVVTLFLTTFSIGVGIGSLWCNKLLAGEISAKYVPFGALGVTLFSADLYFASAGLPAPAAPLMGAADYLRQVAHWRIVIDLLGIAIATGIYTVPLYAILQTRADEAQRSRIIAANNIMNALFMVTGAVAASAMLAMDFSVPSVFLVLAVANCVVAVYVVQLLPDHVFKALFAAIFKTLYRADVRGLENYRAAGDRAVIVANHVSMLDALLLGAFLPGKPTFAIDTHIARKWWVKPFLLLGEALPVDPTSPLATKTMIKAVKEGRHCVIFPEGRLTVTGSLMKVYEGPGMIAEKADAMIVPVRIDGPQYTSFSRLRGKLRLRWFPKFRLTILPPQKFDAPQAESARERRQMTGLKLYDLMADLIFETSNSKQTLWNALLDARHVQGGRATIVEDMERKPISFNRLIMGAIILGRKLAAKTRPAEPVGVMLPNSVGGATAFFALQSIGRVPAMLNFSTGLKNMQTACHAAQINTVLTSRRFIDMAKLDDIVDALSEQVTILYLEDIRDTISLGNKLCGLILSRFPRAFPWSRLVDPDEAAVILFTSGSEGTPKGVVLSHRNLNANRHQLAARIDFNPTDTVFNALPIFHSFGLTGGMLLPILSGIRTFLYPSPLHYRIIPAMVYDSNATILFGTDTFLTGYAKVAHSYDFYSVRYIFAGAERVRDETRRIWSEKFGIRIMEGYGATETSPVLATNSPMHFKAGAVGRFLPGIRYEIEPVPGIEEGGKLIVSGPNIMKGYLRAENPGVLEPAEGNRYDTGDIIDIDAQGFATIKGRAKRFAKIAGEMVSLSAVESQAAAVWPDHAHAVVSLPDARKGEQLVLLTENAAAARDALLAHAKSNGIVELMVPREIHPVEKIPVLGTGKLDYETIKTIATSLMA